MRLGRNAQGVQSLQQQGESILFGGHDPETGCLRLTVEASSAEEARRRMVAVAPMVHIGGAEYFDIATLERPSLTVPLFMEGYFAATRLGMPKGRMAVPRALCAYLISN